MVSSFQIRSWFSYWLDAVGRHSLHSPFYYDFYVSVVEGTRKDHEFRNIEDLRTRMINDHSQIEVVDLGSGSKRNVSSTRRISDIARTSLSTPRFSRMYAKMISHYGCKRVIELGTSLGINTLYLSRNAGSVTSFEGAPAIAEVAQWNFSQAGTSNIDIVCGDIGKTLPDHIAKHGRADFVLIDANHRYNPTLAYFNILLRALHEHSIVVIDDIHQDTEMDQAWNELKQHHLVYGSIDLFRSGILFFDPSLNKQHVVIQV